MQEILGQSINRYRILEKLGNGGMADVFKAFDTHLERNVAIKIIRREVFAPDLISQMLQRFEREAKSLAKLVHPNIVPIIDYGEYEGSPYLVMPLISGGSLKEVLKKRTYNAEQAARLLIPIAKALYYAHTQGILHRDVKPSNILITESNEPLLTDFGVAKIIGESESPTLTGTGIGLGTPEYMAPEQWVGKATPASDQYSLGIVLYEMVTGKKPYFADTPAGVLIKQTTQAFPSPSSIDPTISEEVDQLIYIALAKNEADRFINMQEFADRLQNISQIITRQNYPSNQIEEIITGNYQSHNSTELLIVNDLTDLTVTETNQVEDRHKDKLSIANNIPVANSSLVRKGDRNYKLRNPGKSKRKRNWLIISVPLILIATAVIAVFLSKIFNRQGSKSDFITENFSSLNEIRQENPGTLNDLALSPDGTTYAIASSLGVLFSEFEDVYIPSFTSVPMINIKYSPNGALVASTANNGVVYVIRSSDRMLLGTLDAGVKSKNGICFSGDSRVLATGGSDGTVSVWTLDTFQKIYSIKYHDTQVASVAISPNNSFLASGDLDGIVIISNFNNGSIIEKIDDHYPLPVNSILFSPENWLYTSSLDEVVVIYDSNWEFYNSFFASGPINDMALSPDGQMIALGYADSCQILNSTDGKLILQIGALAEIDRVLFTKDGGGLTFRGIDGSVFFMRAPFEPTNSVEKIFTSFSEN